MGYQLSHSRNSYWEMRDAIHACFHGRIHAWRHAFTVWNVSGSAKLNNLSRILCRTYSVCGDCRDTSMSSVQVTTIPLRFFSSWASVWTKLRGKRSSSALASNNKGMRSTHCNADGDKEKRRAECGKNTASDLAAALPAVWSSTKKRGPNSYNRLITPH